MKTLLVQDYLRSGNSLEDLYKEHAVKGTNPLNGKRSFNYDMLEAKETNALANQCRGLILRENSWDIVAMPFARFFNWGQTGAAEIDWNTAKFFDKLDGSILIKYFDAEQDKWLCATRGMCEAHGQIQDSDITFADLANMAVQKRYGQANVHEFMDRGPKEWRSKTFMFELTSPFNRIVCQYDEIGLTLLGVRDNITFEEHHIEEYANVLGVPTPEQFEFSNINHLIQVIRDWNPKEKEGVVVRDANFNRIKVKNPSYVCFNKMRDSLSTSWRGCAEVILLGTDDDVIPMMPEAIADRIKRLKPLISEVLKRTQADYDELKHIDDMKTFALQAKDRLWPGALFALKRNKTPDLMTFAMGNNRSEKASIPKNALESVLSLCQRLDPDVKEIKLILIEE